MPTPDANPIAAPFLSESRSPALDDGDVASVQVAAKAVGLQGELRRGQIDNPPPQLPAVAVGDRDGVSLIELERQPVERHALGIGQRRRQRYRRHNESDVPGHLLSSQEPATIAAVSPRAPCCGRRVARGACSRADDALVFRRI